MDVFDLDKEYVARTCRRFPIELAYGNGPLVVDAADKEYIDLCAGVGVNSIGVADSQWTTAVTAQLRRYQHYSDLYYSEPCVKLSEQLCKRTGLKKAFFSNSGLEANLFALEAARRYAMEHNRKNEAVILVFNNAYHEGAVSVFQPAGVRFVFAPVNDLDAVRKIVEETSPVAILFEVISIAQEMVPLSQDFVQGLFALAGQKDILLVADETRCGNGRTGALYSYMHYGVLPDIVTTANGLAGGLPLGVSLLGDKVQDVFAVGENRFLLGGNPVACAGALDVLARIDDNFMRAIENRSRMIFDMLRNAPGVRSITGMGLMIGIETKKSPIDIVASCRIHGVLVFGTKNKVCLMPPLNIPEMLLAQAVDIVCQACI